MEVSHCSAVGGEELEGRIEVDSAGGWLANPKIRLPEGALDDEIHQDRAESRPIAASTENQGANVVIAEETVQKWAGEVGFEQESACRVNRIRRNSS